MIVQLYACTHLHEYVCVKVNKCLFIPPHFHERPSASFAAERHSPREALKTTAENLTVGTREGSLKSHCFLVAQCTQRGRGRRNNGGDEVFDKLVGSLLSIERFSVFTAEGGNLCMCLFIGLAYYPSVHLVISIVHKRLRSESSCLLCSLRGVPFHPRVSSEFSSKQRNNPHMRRERAIIAVEKKREVNIDKML